MRRNHPTQLNLLELPVVARRRDDSARRRAAAAMTARHGNALLAEIDRILLEQEARAQHLARLYDAAERASGIDVARDGAQAPSRPTGTGT